MKITAVLDFCGNTDPKAERLLTLLLARDYHLPTELIPDEMEVRELELISTEAQQRAWDAQETNLRLP